MLDGVYKSPKSNHDKGLFFVCYTNRSFYPTNLKVMREKIMSYGQFESVSEVASAVKRK